MSRDWTFCLQDIVECGLRIASYTQEMSIEEFRHNQLVIDAVIRNLEIIGDAARQLPQEVTAAIPGVAWAKTAAFGDVLSHHQFGLDSRIVWDLVRTKIPQMVSSASTVLDQDRRRM